MPRAGFGGMSDASGLFAALAQQYISDTEQRARELERKNDERKAAKDAEMFSKFEHGEISGDEILGYIRKRVGETGHDPEEHAKWKDALRDYETSIADQRAEDQFANGGNIHALIGYYRGRRQGLKSGTPEYSDVNKRLNELVDKAASDDLYVGAERIQDQIDKGKASLGDLANFYKRQLRGLRPGSTIRDQVTRDLDSIEDAIVKQRTESRIAEIDFKYQSNQISGAAAQRQLSEIASTFRISDPARFYQLKEAGHAYAAQDAAERVSTGAAEVDYLFQAGRITAQQANQRMMSLANSVRGTDPQGYYQLLEQGQSYLSSVAQTAIPNPDALLPFGGVGGPAPGGGGNFSGGNWQVNTGQRTEGFSFVTQLDGSAYSRKNCVFASGAMLAQAMGIGDLSGGDLRWLSGDRAGGSDLGWLDRAMGKVGLGLESKNGMGFNAFAQKLGGGQPAVVLGDTRKIPAGLRPGSYQGGHAIYVDRYDAKKGFLVYDPGTRRGRGVWWSPQIMRNFAFSGGMFNGDVGFAPQRLIANPRSRAAPDVNISVWDAPRRNKADKYGDATPRNYGVGNDPGVDGRSQDALDRAGVSTTSRTDRDGNPRPYNLGLPATIDDVESQIDTLSMMQDRALAMADAFYEGNQTYYVEADGTRTPLNEASIRAELNAALDSNGYGSALSYSINDPTQAGKFADNRAQLTTGILKAGDVQQQRRFNQIVADVRKQIEYADRYESDPAKAAAVVATAVGRLNRFAGALDPGDPTEREGVTGGFVAHVRTVVDAIAQSADPNADPVAVGALLAQADMPELIPLTELIGGAAAAVKGLADGTHVRAIVAVGVGPDGKPITEFTAVPATQRDRGDGTVDLVPNLEGRDFTPIIIKGPDGKGVVTYAEYTQIEVGKTLAVRDPLALARLLTDEKAREAVAKWPENTVVPTSLLESLPRGRVEQLIAAGVLSRAPLTYRGIIVPEYRTDVPRVMHQVAPGTGGYDPIVKSKTWIQDPESLLWYADKLPITPTVDPFGLGTVRVGDENQPEVRWDPVGGVVIPNAAGGKAAQELLDSGALAPHISRGIYRDEFGQPNEAVAPPSLHGMYDGRSLSGLTGGAFVGAAQNPNVPWTGFSPGQAGPSGMPGGFSGVGGNPWTVGQPNPNAVLGGGFMSEFDLSSIARQAATFGIKTGFGEGTSSSGSFGPPAQRPVVTRAVINTANRASGIDIPAARPTVTQAPRITLPAYSNRGRPASSTYSPPKAPPTNRTSTTRTPPRQAVL